MIDFLLLLHTDPVHPNALRGRRRGGLRPLVVKKDAGRGYHVSLKPGAYTVAGSANADQTMPLE